MTYVEILMAARNLLTPDGAWTQGAAARDDRGKHVPSKSIDAVCWCLTGALNLASKDSNRSSLNGALHMFALANKIDSLVRWNDDMYRTHDEVLAALDHAIVVNSLDRDV